MATIAQGLPQPSKPLVWFWNFLKDELAPYPGRLATVLRMVLAATLVMLLCMTFRIPYGFQGAIYALLLTRESPRATLRSSALILLFSVSSAAYVLLCARFFINAPILHFVWVIASVFLAFYALTTITEYAVASTFAVVISIVVPLWDRYLPAETNVEDTLWVLLSTALGIVVTAGVELALVRTKPGEEIVIPLVDRLAAVESLLLAYANHRQADDATINRVIRLDVVGTSRLRRLLRRADYSPHYRAQMSSVASLVGRLVDMAAVLTELSFDLTEADQRQLRKLAAAVAGVRTALGNRQIPASLLFNSEDEAAGRVPWLRDMENVVSLIPQAFVGSQAMEAHLPPPDEIPQPRLVAADALVNPEHLKFALKGCLATSACYILYNLVAWQGISTAVTTCLLTALSTIGSSRQKQILRFGGALVGGFVIGMGAQVLVLPYLDSIGGFTLLFVCVTALAAWLLTSSARLSYFGLQLALAFYLINLQEFAIQTSLSVARDRVVGVLLGLFMMWLVFDQLWGAPAAVEMKRQYISGLRLLAQFAREPVAEDSRVTIERCYSLRETINNNFDQVRALADGVLFEFRGSRQQDLALRKSILHWELNTRLIFVTRIVLWKYRIPLPGLELPDPVPRAQQDFDDQLAAVLDALADEMEGRPPARYPDLEDAVERLAQTVQASVAKEPQEVLRTRLETFLSLSRRIESLTVSLEQQMG
jgi:multidrug resistance protein MdtO